MNADRKPIAAEERILPDADPTVVVRRAPFSDNPTVGARGQRTQQRILDAALRVFGEHGYGQSSIDRIAKRAGCSRVAFYQYFSSKEDVLRHLVGLVVRQLAASNELLDAITPDLEGWTTLRAWVARHGDIFARYEPVFQALEEASRSDDVVAELAARSTEHHVASVRSRLLTPTLPPRQLDPVIVLLVDSLTRTHFNARRLRSVEPEAYPDERFHDAFADVMHRTLFGVRERVNVHAPGGPRPRPLRFGPAMRSALQELDSDDLASNVTFATLMDAARDVFVSRGYGLTRVDDLAAAAGVSHGTFYRYFENKAQLAHLLAVRAMRTVSTVLVEVPAYEDGPPDRGALRRWLRRYNATRSNEAAMIRVWLDATLQDPSLGEDSPAAIDWGRRRLARFLGVRDFGDADVDAIIMLALIDVFGIGPGTAATVDAAAHVVQRGLLGR